jgi:hypothetical protein
VRSKAEMRSFEGPGSTEHVLAYLHGSSRSTAEKPTVARRLNSLATIGRCMRYRPRAQVFRNTTDIEVRREHKIFEDGERGFMFRRSWTRGIKE